MKQLLAILFIVSLVGCANKAIVIPDAPVYENMSAYRYEKGVCFDNENEAILLRNMWKLDEYSKKLRGLLVEKNKEGL